MIIDLQKIHSIFKSTSLNTLKEDTEERKGAIEQLKDRGYDVDENTDGSKLMVLGCCYSISIYCSP